MGKLSLFRKNVPGTCISFVIFVILCFLSLYVYAPFFRNKPTGQRNESELHVMDRSIISGVQNIIDLNNKKTFVEAAFEVIRTRKSYNLRIIAIVFDRFNSLLRLLKSLNEAYYYNDDIKLDIWIDRSKNDTVDAKTFAYAKDFNFLHGEKSVHVQKRHVGIYGQWLATLDIKDDGKEIAVILEDDITVSKYFYKYLKMIHEKYDSVPDINGYALQGVSIKHGLPQTAGWLRGPENQNVFLYPVLGTWGFSPSPRSWRGFINWFMTLFKDNLVFVPTIPGNIASNWYKTLRNLKRHDGIWEIWHIYYAWCNKEYTLYTNYGDNLGFTTNWMEAGLHYSAKSVNTSSNKLVTEWKPEYDTLPTTPVRINIHGKLENTKSHISVDYTSCKQGFPDLV